MKKSHRIGVRKSIFKKDLSLDNYIFSVFLSLLFIIAIINVVGNVLTSFPMVANVKWGFCIILSVIGYRLVEKQLFLETFKVLVFGSLLFFVVIPSWFYGGGDNVVTLLYLMLIAVESFLMFKRVSIKCTFAALCAFSSVGLMITTHYFPNIIQGNKEQNVFADNVMQITIIFIIAIISIAIYTNRYEKQLVLSSDLNERLQHLSITDALSNTYNKRKIIDLLSTICAENKLLNIAIVMLDIDYFKTINDTFGHIVGDDAICHVANHFTKVVDNSGSVGRYGGDEFMLIIYDLPDDDIKPFTEKLLNVPDFNKFPITISGGLIKRTDNQDWSSLINLADENLLSAKRSGRNMIKW